MNLRTILPLAALAWLAPLPAGAADPGRPPPAGRFLATCEDLGQFCFAEGCGRDQIAAALACRRACPSAVVRRVVPAVCPLSASPVLRRRG